jgi:DnaK suppressor protein
MSTRFDATPVATTHLSAAQLTRLHRLLLDEHVAQQGRAAELQDPQDLEPDLVAILLSRCHEALDDIEGALTLLDQGTYGLCLSCGAAIPYERLEAVPAARHCVSCPAGGDRDLS